MLLCSFIQELYPKEENNTTSCCFNFELQCKMSYPRKNNIEMPPSFLSYAPLNCINLFYYDVYLAHLIMEFSQINDELCILQKRRERKKSRKAASVVKLRIHKLNKCNFVYYYIKYCIQFHVIGVKTCLSQKLRNKQNSSVPYCTMWTRIKSTCFHIVNNKCNFNQ